MIDMIGSLKGGSGKSTVTFNLGVFLSRAGVPVKLLDTDPQATLSDVIEIRTEDGYEPEMEVEGKSSLNKKLATFDGRVLIDVGTSDMAALRKAISLADRILVPVPPSQADIWSAQRFLKIVADEAGDKMPEVIGFINRGDTNPAVRESDEAAAALIALPGIEFTKQRLYQRTAYRRSFSEGLAVFELEPRGKAAAEVSRLAAALYPDVLS